MRPAAQLATALREPVDVGEARRSAVALAQEVGFGEVDCGRVALVVTEAATNVLKHAGSGEIVVGADAGPSIAILALDAGPGIGDLERAFTDGFSTAKSSGVGLGAIRRLASSLDVWTRAGRGTVLAAHVFAGPPPSRRSWSIGAIHLPLRGERACGDAFTAEVMDERALFAVADGLGHGPLAAEASMRAMEIVKKKAGAPLEQIMLHVHEALRSTRGAAMALVEVNVSRGIASFAGAGNVAASIHARQGSKTFVGQNGTLGAEIRKTQVTTTPWAKGAMVVMHTDGLLGRWDLAGHAGLFDAAPMVVAGLLYRDFSRGKDDVTVLVAREEQGP